MTFSQDDKHTISAPWLNKISIWNVEAGTTMKKHSPSFSTLSPDGKYVTSQNGRVNIWNAETGLVTSVPFDWSDQSSRRTANASPRAHTMRKPPSGIQTAVISGPFQGPTCSFQSTPCSRDGSEGEMHIWDTKTDTIASGSFEGYTNRASSVAFSPNGKYIFSGSSDSTICV